VCSSDLYAISCRIEVEQRHVITLDELYYLRYYDGISGILHSVLNQLPTTMGEDLWA
jgi:hypothetical protein